MFTPFDSLRLYMFNYSKKEMGVIVNNCKLMYWSNWSFNMRPPGIPRAFDTFAVPGRREFDYQSLPGGGEFDPHALGVGIWTAPSISCEISGLTSYHGERSARGFSWKRFCLCGQLVTGKGLKQVLCRIWRYLNFHIFDIGFRLWICVYNDIQYLRIPIPVNYFDLPHVC